MKTMKTIAGCTATQMQRQLLMQITIASNPTEETERINTTTTKANSPTAILRLDQASSMMNKIIRYFFHSYLLLINQNAEVGNEVNPDTICREERNGDEAEASVTEERSDHGDDDDSDSDDEDDVVVTIGDIKAGSNYNIKQRGNLLTQGPAATVEKPKANAGKFSIEEFESVGTISGQLAHEFSIDSLDEKPWRKPGADITDYFNYGFNEETWRAYCEKQKRMRLHESGVGLQGLAAASNNAQAGGSNGAYLTVILIALLTLPINPYCSFAAPNRTLTSVPSGDNSKYLSSGPPNIIAGPSKFPNRLGLGAAPGRNGIDHNFTQDFFISARFLYRPLVFFAIVGAVSDMIQFSFLIFIPFVVQAFSFHSTWERQLLVYYY